MYKEVAGIPPFRIFRMEKSMVTLVRDAPTRAGGAVSMDVQDGDVELLLRKGWRVAEKKQGAKADTKKADADKADAKKGVDVHPDAADTEKK